MTLTSRGHRPQVTRIQRLNLRSSYEDNAPGLLVGLFLEPFLPSVLSNVCSGSPVWLLPDGVGLCMEGRSMSNPLDGRKK